MKTRDIKALQNRQLLLSVRLVNAAHATPVLLTAPQRFDALSLAYHFGLWRARQFNQARALLAVADATREAA